MLEAGGAPLGRGLRYLGAHRGSGTGLGRASCAQLGQGKRHADLLGQGWWEPVHKTIRRLQLRCWSRDQVICVRAAVPLGPGSPPQCSPRGAPCPSMVPWLCSLCPQVAEHAGPAGQPGHRRGGAPFLPRPRPQPPCGPELQPFAGRSAQGCHAAAGFSLHVSGILSLWPL